MKKVMCFIMVMGLLAIGSTALADRTDINRVTLINGDIMSGEVLTTIKLKTSYGNLEFEPQFIQHITFENNPYFIDQIILKIGDRMTGTILNKDVTIRMTNGASITIDRDKIKYIAFLKLRR